MSFVRCKSQNYSVYENAPRLADAMHRIAHWAKNHPNSQKFTVNLLKLPPVFASNENSKSNLIAMIKTLAEYEEGYPDGTYPTLQELPARYNANGGSPKLEEKDMRKVHNWLQQVSFGLRAALIDQEMNQAKMADTNKEEIAETVFNKLYSNERRAFVTFSPDNKYELKPLKHASDTAKKSWIMQEIDQRLSNSEYGAKPHLLEWEVYGFKGHRTSCAAITVEIDTLMKQASDLDSKGLYEKADQIDIQLTKCFNDLAIMERISNANWSF